MMHMGFLQSNASVGNESVEANFPVLILYCWLSNLLAAWHVIIIKIIFYANYT